MIGRPPLLALLGGLLVVLPPFGLGGERTAWAETRRLAVLVGNNVGTGARPALRFAEEDVDRLAAVLRELGGWAGGDLVTIKAGDGARLQEGLREIRRRIASWRQRPDQRAVVLFYYSGHSDGLALELGRERLPFGEVRRLLAETGAEVRLAIVDSCRAGGLLAVKGGKPGPGFDVHITDTLASTGEAFITSSAAEESALESEEIRGSFFSHHLVSGLRGAADTSGDGQVTLAEAYQYAFARTVSATADTLIGPQHPGYDYRLSGRGDVVLTRLSRPSALLEMPTGFSRLLLADQRRGEVLAELGPRAARRVAVPAGRYRLLGWSGGQLYETQLAVAAGEVRAVPAQALTLAAPLAGLAKGDVAGTLAAEAGARPAEPTLLLVAAAGFESAVAASLGRLPGARLALARTGRRSPILGINLASGRGTGFRESRAELRAGVQQRWSVGRLSLGLGAELGGGLAIQQIDGEAVRRTGVAAVALTGAARMVIRSPLSIVLSTEAPARLLRRADRNTVLFAPAAWLGLGLVF